ncbi:MAG: DUF2147 domain-containing protein [Sphingomicrobium sp.]
MRLIANLNSQSRRPRTLVYALVALGLQPAAQATAPQTGIAGRWINPSRSVIIDIAPCGAALCGTVKWASAKAKADASAGTARLVGTRLLTGLRRQGSQWQGKLFVPDRNLHVEGRIERAAPGQLKVSGCALGGLVCDSQLWTRARGKLKP